ncbi:MAG: ribbon-helix-helix domain-containing protein [Candidatus Thorarchaeota archaeon]
METVTVSLSLEKEDVEWLDRLVAAGLIRNRSEAVRKALSAYLKVLLQHESRKELRQYLSDQTKTVDAISAEELFHEMRKEEDT